MTKGMWVLTWVGASLIITAIYMLILQEQNTEIYPDEYTHLAEDQKKFPYLQKEFSKITKDNKVTNKEFEDIHEIIAEYIYEKTKTESMNELNTSRDIP